MPANGFKPDFIDPSRKSLSVNWPTLSVNQQQDLAEVGDNGKLHYDHFSLALSKSRRFPYYTATNIDGSLFKKIKRADIFDGGKDVWEEDSRAGNHQWGQKLYDAPKSYFDRGHMTKREDPQWGQSITEAKKAARSTFQFPNCVPQHAALNQRIWASLETYILTKQSVPNKLRISVFTGPVISGDDPEFVTPVNGQIVQLPVLFWKVVYYSSDGKSLSRVAFLMGQEDLLIDNGIARSKLPTRLLNTFFAPSKKLFMDYEDAETYQINMKTVQKLSGLTFTKAKEPYKDTRPLKLIKKVVQAKDKKKSILLSVNEDISVPEFKITNIKL
ncbi:MAG: DNA/RNA non-specific endonuclease [Cyclobacteriaceae bacterium]|nr:DNA/RNA non-specific endonuclease [Cyclobacteriaceae bacterium]